MAKYFFRLFGTALILQILFSPSQANAGTLYRCEDRAGNVSITDYPLPANTCRAAGTFEEMTAEEKLDIEKEQKKEQENKDKILAAEAEKQKAAEDLAKCYEDADLNRSNCGGYFTGGDDFFVNAVIAECNSKLEQEREQCRQQYPQKP